MERIGGKTGWYYGQWLWRIRGWLEFEVETSGDGSARVRQKATFDHHSLSGLLY